jgi:hypothetical protein
MQTMGLIVVCCGMALKRIGKLRVSVRKMKALNVKIKGVTLIGKGRQNLTCIMYLVCAVNSETFFSADVLFMGGLLRFG